MEAAAYALGCSFANAVILACVGVKAHHKRTSRAFPKFESYLARERIAQDSQKGDLATDRFHGIDRLAR